jgi:hypothetical protein
MLLVSTSAGAHTAHHAWSIQSVWGAHMSAGAVLVGSAIRAGKT